MIEQHDPHRGSAWLVSVLFHVCLLLGVALIATLTPAALPPDEQGRPVAIVLRDISSTQQMQYLSESDPSDAQAGTTEAKSMPLAAALPVAEQSVPLASLPQTDLLGPLPNVLEFPVMESERQSARTIRSGNDQAVIDADLAAQRRRAAGRPTGPTAEVSLFGSAGAVGHRFVLVIDRSKSMGGEGLGVLEAADGQLAAALKRLYENHSFQIIAYNDHLDRYPKKGLTSATPQAKEQALTFVRGLAAFRGTEHGLALLAASQTEADVIFLLTDGGYPEPAAYEMRDILSGCDGRTTIHALQFGFGPQQQAAVFMETLAQRTHGSYTYVDVSKW